MAELKSEDAVKLKALHCIGYIVNKSKSKQSLLKPSGYINTHCTHTKCRCPGGGIGTSDSLAANSFTFCSMSDKRQVLSWIDRLERNSQRD